MAVKYFPMLIQGRANQFPDQGCRFGVAFILQPGGKGIHGRHMLCIGSAPGDILQQAHDVFGPAPVSGIGQLTGFDGNREFAD
jgi:hypothetical protein